MVDTVDTPAATDVPATDVPATPAAAVPPVTTDTPDTTLSPAAPAATDAPKDDWAATRSKIAGADEKLLKQLSRYGSLDEAVKAGVEAQKKLAGTRSVAKPGKDATDAEKAAYREANGIPESADKYDLQLPAGLVIGDADKPFLDAFLKTAHDNNLTPEQVNAAANSHFALLEQQVQARNARDEETKVAANEALTEAWGSERDLNLNLIHGLLDTAPAGVKEQLLGARMGDGTPFGNSADALKWLATLAREQNPVATVVPGSGANAQQALAGELEQIQSLMGDMKSEYWKGPRAEKMQARYRELLEVQDKVAARG